MDIIGCYDVENLFDFDTSRKFKGFKAELEKIKQIISSEKEKKKIPEVNNIIFNDPATIVYWQDGTKTVVKTMHGDTFNEEYGVAMAYMKKMFGSSSGFKKLVAKYKK